MTPYMHKTLENFDVHNDKDNMQQRLSIVYHIGSSNYGSMPTQGIIEPRLRS